MNKETEHKELYLGTRKISHMNFSYIVTIPKIFVQNSMNGGIIKTVKIMMLQDGSLKIIPIHEKSEPVELCTM